MAPGRRLIGPQRLLGETGARLGKDVAVVRDRRSVRVEALREVVGVGLRLGVRPRVEQRRFGLVALRVHVVRGRATRVAVRTSRVVLLRGLLFVRRLMLRRLRRIGLVRRQRLRRERVSPVGSFLEADVHVLVGVHRRLYLSTNVCLLKNVNFNVCKCVSKEKC